MAKVRIVIEAEIDSPAYTPNDPAGVTAENLASDLAEIPQIALEDLLRTHIDTTLNMKERDWLLRHYREKNRVWRQLLSAMKIEVT